MIDLARFQRAIKGAVFQALQEIRADAVRNVSNKILRRRTGLLANSIFTEIRGEPGAIIGVLGVDGPAAVYARVWEFTGMERHLVKPKRYKALRWKDKEGFDVFAKRAMIPAQKERPFLGPAIEANIGRAEKLIVEAAERATARELSRRMKGAL